MVDCHWPQAGIRHLRPVESRMNHHGSGYGHDSLDGTFGLAVMMVSTYSCVSDGLIKGREVLLEIS